MEASTERGGSLPGNPWWRAGVAAFATAALILGGLAFSAGRVDSAPIADRWSAVADTYVIQEYPNASPGGDSKVTAAQWSSWHTRAYLRFRVDQLRTDLPVASIRLAFTFQRTQSQPSLTELRAVPSNAWSEADAAPTSSACSSKPWSSATSAAGSTTAWCRWAAGTGQPRRGGYSGS